MSESSAFSSSVHACSVMFWVLSLQDSNSALLFSAFRSNYIIIQLIYKLWIGFLCNCRSKVMVLGLHFQLILMSHLCFQINGHKLDMLCVSVLIS
jgi:hypothetical protein